MSPSRVPTVTEPCYRDPSWPGPLLVRAWNELQQRKNIEDEAIDLTCKPEFTEVNEGVTALRMLLLVEQT